MDVLTQALDLFVKFATIGGGLFSVWGVITLAGGLRDHNGAQTQTGMWQLVGGGMVVGAAQLFSAIAL
ncbi:MAG: hypothetical protein WBH73_08800 [Arcanobacterium sp.]